MNIPVGALWKKGSDNPRAPILYGSLEVRDREVAMKIAETLVRGERVRIAIFKGKGEVNGKRYPDYNIALDTYEKEQGKSVQQSLDDVPF